MDEIYREPRIPIDNGINYPDPKEVYSPKYYSSALVKKQVSLGGFQQVGIQVVDEKGQLTSVDNIRLTVYDKEEIVQSYEEVENPELGVYSVVVGPPTTSAKRQVRLKWTYEKGGQEVEFYDDLVVTERMPTYEALTDGEKYVVEQVNNLFGDLFDSTEGGVHLSENFQTHFNYERIAQLMSRALQKINITSQPLTSYIVGSPGGGQRMPQKYHGVLVSATYLEVLRHLIRSYTEVPEFRGMSTTYTDRRDYMQRWRSVLDEEKEEVANAITLMKREHLNLGGGALLVSGGIFGSGGRGGGYFRNGMYSSSARGFRLYPTAPLVRI